MSCGTVVTTDIALHRDLIGCPTDGLIVGARGITIDLNGHRITGMTSDNSGDPTACRCGINDRAGYGDVTVKNGRLTGFVDGARFDGTARVNVVDVTSGAHYNNALMFNGGSDAVITGSTLADSFRGIWMADAKGMTIRGGTITGNAHAGVAIFRSNAARVIGMSGDAHGGDYAVEVVDSKGTYVARNAFTGFGADGIVLVGETTFGHTPSSNNTVVSNDLRRGSTGIELIEIDGGHVLHNIVRDNTIRNTDDSGILLDAVTSQNGSPPYTYLTGVGPSHNQIVSNTSDANALDGIHLSAPYNFVAGNTADHNGGWGIYSVPANVDGGDNSAKRNKLGSCLNIDC